MKTLRAIRKAKQIKQTQIVRLLNITSGCYSQWENGKRQPGIEQIPKIAQILNCSIEDVVLAIIKTKEKKDATCS